MDGVRPYAFLGVAASLYAVALNTKLGKTVAREQTWFSVVMGTSLVLGVARRVIPAGEWRKVALAFIVAGVPIISRSLYNKIKQ